MDEFFMLLLINLGYVSLGVVCGFGLGRYCRRRKSGIRHDFADPPHGYVSKKHKQNFDKLRHQHDWEKHRKDNAQYLKNWEEE